LALATSVGAWINLSLLALFARRQGFAVSGAAIGRPVVKLLIAGAVLGLALLAGEPALKLALSGLAYFRDEIALALLVLLGAVVYGAAVLLLLKPRWLKGLLEDVGVAADTEEPPLPPDPTDDSASFPDSQPPPKA
jgi:putative peptidoglycan lipid II flippase